MVLAAQIKFFFILGHQSKSCIFVVHSALLAHIYVIENKCKHAIKFNCKCKTSLSLKFYDPQMAMFDVQQVQWHHFSFQAGVNRNYIVLEKQVHKDVRKKKNVENIRQIGKNHETGKRCDGAGDRANSPPFWAFSLHVRAVIQDEPWKRCPLLIIFFFFSSFSSPLCSSVLTDKKELRLGLKTTHSIGQQRWEESHTQWDIACMPRKERMLQLEGNAVFAVPCKHCHEATHRFVPGGTSVRFTCPFSIYAINRSNATCIPEILNAVRWNTALVFLDGHFQG